ncbi:MAG: asparagine synthetase B, partial [Planctomycetes bacterium]|nr:asparagine synthetase B [Planctomycetota bacterium]
MSGICGVFRFDGGPVDGALLERMIDRIAWRGPEGRGRWVGPGAALGFTRFATTPEAAAETQPLLDPESGLVLVLDGRIDNREEVLASLRQRGAAPREPSDAGILLAAWKAMGEACLLRLAGDYALLLWDGRRRRLVAARDPLGIRPLFRASDGGALLLASDPLSLLAHPALPAEPAEGYLAEILAEEARSWEETLHRGVLRVPPGHLLEAGEGGARLRLAFDPTPLPRPPGASLATDAEAFRAVFDEAVRCRLRVPPGGKAPGILLSGGVDSGAVALAAAGIRAAEGGGRGDLLAVSGVFPGEPFDEEPLIRETAAAAGIGLLRGLPVEVPPGEPAREAAATGALPLSPLGRTHYLLLAAAGGAGRRVLLTGNGGDEWPGGTPYLLSTVLARREAGAFLRLLRRRGAARG